MPILIIEHKGSHQAGTLTGRVLIGRWPNNTIVISDRTVSRIHAWIGVQDGRYYIADAGSRTGTFVNGEPLQNRRPLEDGDHILIGSAVLLYRAEPELPEAFAVADLSPRSAEELSDEKGIFKDCVCGAPLWLPREYTGTGRCRYCGQMVRATQADGSKKRDQNSDGGNVKESGSSEYLRNGVGGTRAGRETDSKAPSPLRPPSPARSATPVSRQDVAPVEAPMDTPSSPIVAAPEPELAPGRAVCCGVCHSAIEPSEETTRCPSCNLIFHADCWIENRGCSAFGCQQVGVLDQPEPKDPAVV